MNNKAKKLLFDVLESARSIQDWCATRTFADYESDRQIEFAHQYAVGMKHVFVNGVPVLKDGQPTGAKSGRALWGPGKIK